MFSNFWAHPVETAWPTWMALCQNVRRSVSYILAYSHLTTLRKTETVDYKIQNWYYVTHFLDHPVEPRVRWVHTHATDG